MIEHETISANGFDHHFCTAGTNGNMMISMPAFG